MSVLSKGHLNKMTVGKDTHGNVHYSLTLGEKTLNLNAHIGHHVTLTNLSNISCVACGKTTDKSYKQGHCGDCASSLARCDICIIKPEKCHYHLGTCREPSWGEDNCLKPHVVYLSFTSGFKVGITREANLPDRWIDQGAIAATPMFRVKERLLSGEVETAFAKLVADKTQWRAMLKGDSTISETALFNKVSELKLAAKEVVEQLQLKYGADAIEHADSNFMSLNYPVKRYPDKIGNTHNLDKFPELSGTLHGIKGQYLYIGDTVINIRKYAGYEVTLELK